ncbi:hypothetical protein BH23PLA1_BH23PLA1_38950 [soil metagenome]
MSWYRLAANVVVLIHASYVFFVVFGLVAILIGLALGKSWARNFWLRMVHLTMIVVVVVQAWLGVVCPLTTLENWLRRQAGQELYETDFIEHWAHRLIFFEFPPWVFIASYSVFGLIVLATFLFSPPRRPFRQMNNKVL